MNLFLGRLGKWYWLSRNWGTGALLLASSQDVLMIHWWDFDLGSAAWSIHYVADTIHSILSPPGCVRSAVCVLGKPHGVAYMDVVFQQAVLGKCEGRMPPWHILIYIAFRFTYLTSGSSLFFFFFKWWIGKLRKKKIQEVKNSEPCQSIFLTVFSDLPWKWTWSRESRRYRRH